MRILYIDIDSLRPDHLGCYGYHRNTSPNIDAVAAEGVRFDHVYVSDVPCLPSRTALWSGRFGFRTGVVTHGGAAAIPFGDGASRGHGDTFGRTGWMSRFREAGYRTVTVSSFAARHAAWHWYAGYREIYDPGKGGMDQADEVADLALDWLRRRGTEDRWFLHVNFWDPHTPYRAPLAFGEPFADDPLPAWLTEDVRRRGWGGFGPHSPQEPQGFGGEGEQHRFPRYPDRLDSMESVKQWIDGYDTGIRYADEHIGRLFDALRREGIFDETVVFIGADHGENHGELNVWGDHQTADACTCRIPLVVRWPGVTDKARVDRALHYHFDWAATVLELAGLDVPDGWDGRSFADVFEVGREEGRPHLILGQGTWACQRSVRFEYAGEAWLCMRTYHDGYKMLEPLMLFNLTEDPHEQRDLGADRPDLVDRAMSCLSAWHHAMMLKSRNDVDPLMTVLREGGPFYTRGRLSAYLERLRATDRAHHAKRLSILHPNER